MYKLNCTLQDAGQTVAISEKFSKRDIVVSFLDGKYEQKVSFQLVNDKVGLVDAYRPGDEIELTFVVKGREWTSPKDGEVKVFNTLEAVRIEGNAAPIAQQSVADDDEPPF